MCLAGSVTGAPVDVAGGVTVGKASIERNGGNTLVRLSESSRIEWSDFTLQSGETLRYVSDPGARFASLNVVKGAGAANIHGTIQADGPFYLVSPAGITVGSTGLIQAPHVFLSALRPADDLALLQGTPTTFARAGAGLVRIDGTVQATQGNLVVAGGGVNIGKTGRLTSSGGTVQVVAATRPVAGPGADGLFMVPQTAGAMSGSSIQNEGNIQAHRVEFISDGTIRNAGRLETRGTGSQVALRAPAIRHEARADGGSVIVTSNLVTEGEAVLEGTVVSPVDGSNPSGVGGLRQTPRLSRPGVISTLDARATQLSASPLQAAATQTTSPIPQPNRSASTLAARRGADDDEARKKNAATAKARGGTVRKASFFGQTVTR